MGGDKDLTRRCAYYSTSSETAARYGPKMLSVPRNGIDASSSRVRGAGHESSRSQFVQKKTIQTRFCTEIWNLAGVDADLDGLGGFISHKTPSLLWEKCDPKQLNRKSTAILTQHCCCSSTTTFHLTRLVTPFGFDPQLVSVTGFPLSVFLLQCWSHFRLYSRTKRGF